MNVSTSQSEDRLEPPSDIVGRRLGDSTVLIRLHTNRIYELNATGARIWELIVEGVPLRQVVATLQREFDVDAGTAAEAVDELVVTLRREGLIEQPSHG